MLAPQRDVVSGYFGRRVRGRFSRISSESPSKGPSEFAGIIISQSVDCDQLLFDQLVSHASSALDPVGGRDHKSSGPVERKSFPIARIELSSTKTKLDSPFLGFGISAKSAVYSR